MPPQPPVYVLAPVHLPFLGFEVKDKDWSTCWGVGSSSCETQTHLRSTQLPSHFPRAQSTCASSGCGGWRSVERGVRTPGRDGVDSQAVSSADLNTDLSLSCVCCPRSPTLGAIPAPTVRRCSPSRWPGGFGSRQTCV